ncbi:MAG: RNA polymerase sigma factor [Blastocatellia bacterium]|nr:RNA polymerase sigma factor [Blastocatellia bacterium]
MHTTLSDEELLAMMRAGDEGAFVSLYRRRQKSIYRFALRMSGSEAIAEDVTQDVFMTLICENGNYDSSRGTLAAYLYGIARYQVLRRIEKDRALIQIGDERADLPNSQNGSSISLSQRESTLAGLIALNDPLRDLTRAELIEKVRQAVLSLPSHYREVVVLCDLHELSYAETASALGCAIGTVRSRLHRARALLLEKLSSQSAENAAENLAKSLI